MTIDQGTSSTKTAVWDSGGGLVTEATAAYELHRPKPLWAEIDAEQWWNALCTTVSAVLAKSGVNPRDVGCVALDGIGWTLVPVDAAFRPLAPAMTWLDRRAEPEAARLRAAPWAERLVDLAANPIDAAYITPKLAWLRAHQQDVFDGARWFLTASGFLTARLTGEATCDLTQAYGFHCFDIRGERWDTDAAAKLSIPIERLPPLRAAWEVAGEVTPQAAAAAGLAPGTPVVVGALDAAVGALGGGVTRPGQTQDQGGQAGGMGLSVESVVVEPRLIFSHHVLRGQYLLQSGTVGGGGALRWLRDVLCRADATFDELTAEAATAPPGCGGLLFLPYLAGERSPLWSSTARGVFVGLSYATTSADLVRAVMEGCAFAVLDNLRVAETTGVRVTEWLGTGGAARSALWNQIKADVTGRPFVVAHRADGGEGGHGLGLFALAAQATELGAAAETVERLLPNRTTFEPHPARQARYAELFEVYHEVSRGLLPAFDHLATAAGGTGS